MKSYLRALEINDKSPECHFNLASAYNDLGEFQQAAKHYLTCTQLDRANVDAFICLGVLSEQLKELEEARKAYD